MDANILSSLISGVFSALSALGAVYLRHYLDRESSPNPSTNPTPDPAPERAHTFWDKLPLFGTLRGTARRVVLLLLAGCVFGYIAPLVNAYYGYDTLHAFLVVLSLAGFSLFLAYLHRTRGSQLQYQLENVVLWTAFLSIWSIFIGELATTIIRPTMFVWLATAIVGGLLISVWQK